jgi:antitoxin component of MazEF toxin-antitoxin module
MPASSKKNKAKKAPASAAKGKKPRTAYKQPEPDNRVNEPVAEYTTKIRAIGNSKGVILNNQLLDIAGFLADQDILIRAINGQLTIEPVKRYVVNTDLSTWDKQFKAAIKAGDIPEGDMFEGMENEFDKTEW